eukprot:Partr_v1_DN25740_c0_g1_i1_m74838 putative ribosomal RNA processing 15 homolog (S. cerevisiae)
MNGPSLQQYRPTCLTWASKTLNRAIGEKVKNRDMRESDGEDSYFSEDSEVYESGGEEVESLNDISGSDMGSEAEMEDVEEETAGKKRHAGLMDAMSKIINKPTRPHAKSIILSKAQSIERKLDEEAMLAKARRAQLAEEKQQRDRDHSRMPTVDYSAELEKRMRTVATRGVVKLFNAFSHQQRTVSKLKKSANRPAIRRKEEEKWAAKCAFLSYLNSQPAPVVDNVSTLISSPSTKKDVPATWLNQDFGEQADLKGWDEIDD